MDIKIEYDGKYPNLCSGKLVVLINGKRWEFPDYCMVSGGYVRFDSDWNAHIGYGDWSLDSWPVNFPEKYKSDVLEKINETVPQGCCGGCI